MTTKGRGKSFKKKIEGNTLLKFQSLHVYYLFFFIISRIFRLIMLQMGLRLKNLLLRVKSFHGSSCDISGCYLGCFFFFTLLNFHFNNAVVRKSWGVTLRLAARLFDYHDVYIWKSMTQDCFIISRLMRTSGRTLRRHWSLFLKNTLSMYNDDTLSFRNYNLNFWTKLMKQSCQWNFFIKTARIQRNIFDQTVIF